MTEREEGGCVLRGHQQFCCSVAAPATAAAGPLRGRDRLSRKRLPIASIIKLGGGG